MSDREISFWGWGYSDRFSDESEREELAELVEGFLGFPERPILEPPTVDSVEVPESRIEPGFGFCDVSKDARVRHTYGKAYRDLVRGFHGDFSPAPDAVARPRSEDDVEELLDWASDESVAVVPFGGGTSVVGGVECEGDGFSGVVSLDMRRMDDVVAVDETSRSARIQAGAVGPEIQDQLSEYGLQLRHYPQSYEFSTLGGWIATRAGGHFATLYTHIDDFVQNVRMVTPAATFETRRLPASGAGPDPNRLVLGSEGALGVITEAWIRVQPRPRHRSRATVRFDDYGEAVEATREIVQERLYPANCRLLDSSEAMLNRITFDGSHVLFLGFESLDGPVRSELDRALGICEEHGGDWDDVDGIDGQEGRDADSEENDWRSSFFEAPYRFNDLVSLGVIVDTFETAVTWDGFERLHSEIQDNVMRVMEDECGDGFISCRLTHVYPDGPAPYYTVLAPADVGRELEQWREIKRVASDTIDEYGGTVTHHHAVGRVHRDWYRRESPAGFRDSLEAVKNVLDPEGIMNPGVLLGRENETGQI